MNLQTIIFIGRSGCGKGTQIEKLKDLIEKNTEKKVFHLEAGQRFREFINSKKYYSSEIAEKIQDDGGLQPEFLSIWVWSGELVENLKEDDHLFIDGTPRRVSEAKVLESVFDFYNRKKVQIIYLNVSRDWSKEKLIKRGRLDDIEISDIEARLNWFDSDVVPVIDYFRGHRQHTFHEINGEQSIDDVHKDIVKSLGL